MWSVFYICHQSWLRCLVVMQLYVPACLSVKQCWKSIRFHKEFVISRFTGWYYLQCCISVWEVDKEMLPALNVGLIPSDQDL